MSYVFPMNNVYLGLKKHFLAKSHLSKNGINPYFTFQYGRILSLSSPIKNLVHSKYENKYE